MVVESASEDGFITKDRILVTTLPLDLVNRPRVSMTVKPCESTVVR